MPLRGSTDWWTPRMRNARWPSARMHIRADGHRAFLIRGVHQSVEPLSGIRAHRQQPDIVDHDQPRTEDHLDGLGDRIVGTVAPHQHAQFLEAEPRHFEAGLDGELTEPFEEERLTGPRWATYHQILVAADPLERAQRTLGR